MQKALGSIPSTGKEGKEGERNGGREGKLRTTESRVKREGEKKLPRAGRIQGRLGTVAGRKTAKEAVPVIFLTLRPHHLQKPGRGDAHSPACLPHLPFPGAAVPKYLFVCWASMRDPKPTQQKYEGGRSPPCLCS